MTSDSRTRYRFLLVWSCIPLVATTMGCSGGGDAGCANGAECGFASDGSTQTLREELTAPPAERDEAGNYNLRANLRLYGEVCRFGIGYGDFSLHFGIGESVPYPAPTLGSLVFNPNGSTANTGVLESVVLPSSGYTIVDVAFSVPFTMRLDEPYSFYMGLGDSGGGSWLGGSKQVIFDFSNNIRFGGGSLPLCVPEEMDDPRCAVDQGFTLESVTLDDGTPLEEVGLHFEFIPENTEFIAGASGADVGHAPTKNTVVPTAYPSDEVAWVLIPKSTASAKYLGGFDGGGRPTEAIVDLDASPEPDPYVFDLAFAVVRGDKNVRLVKPDPDPLPAVALASELSILTSEICESYVVGTATDADNDPLSYRWLLQGSAISDWTPTNADGELVLELCGLEPEPGNYTLTVEVSDGNAVVSDNTSINILNTPPELLAPAAQTVESGTPIALSGVVSDFDGDALAFVWSEEGSQTPLCSGTVDSLEGGGLVELAPCEPPAATLGQHAYVLTVNDGVNLPVSVVTTVTVVDTTPPALALETATSILWPPNHWLVPVTVQVMISDNSNEPVTLTATINSNEPADDLGDGAFEPDYTEPVFDAEKNSFSFSLRAERSGLGSGRVYTVTVTAEDSSGNQSTASIEVLVPHDLG